MPRWYAQEHKWRIVKPTDEQKLKIEFLEKQHEEIKKERIRQTTDQSTTTYKQPPNQAV
jgi:hypothetical protein